MSGYVRGARRARLGNTATTALVSIGANAIVPGSGPIVAASSGVLQNFFSGSNTDATRQARVDWFTQAARQGSVIAARLILGGPTNTASHEAPMWQRAMQLLQGTPAMTQALALGPSWPVGEDFTAPQTRARIEAELEAQGKRSPTSSYSPTIAAPSTSPSVIPSRAVMLPGMQSTAPFNYVPWLLGAGALTLGAFAISRRRSH